MASVRSAAQADERLWEPPLSLLLCRLCPRGFPCCFTIYSGCQAGVSGLSDGRRSDGFRAEVKQHKQRTNENVMSECGSATQSFFCQHHSLLPSLHSVAFHCQRKHAFSQQRPAVGNKREFGFSRERVAPESTPVSAISEKFANIV